MKTAIDRYGSAKAVVRSGLAPSSFLHFRMEERTGQVITDMVEGVTVDKTTVSPFEYIVPNAITVRSTTGVVDYGNTPSHWSTPMTTGAFVMYGCSRVRDVIGEGHLFMPTDSSGDAPLLFLEESDSQATSPGKYHGLVSENVVELLRGNGRSTEQKSFYLMNKGVYGFAVCVPFDQEEPVCCYDNGDEIYWRQDGNDNSKYKGGIAIPQWTFRKDAGNGAKMGFRSCDGYVMGALWIKDAVPSKDELKDCSEWHKINAPKGQKNVWPGWNKYI